jgi:uncharacterized heparinase superfamily protein
MSQQAIKSDRRSALGWYYRRLRSMPLVEIPHRIVELIHRRTSKTGFWAKRDARLPDAVSGQALPTLPLNAGFSQEVVGTDESRSLAAEVDSLCAGDIELLGQQWPSGQLHDWAIDPESGVRWPWQRYTFDIPRRHGQGPGDIKFVWELSRLQHLQVLALGAHVLGREDARQCCLTVLDKWLDDNPPYIGLGYVSGIELASRVISILVAVTYLGQDSFEPALREKVWRSIVTHGRFIARFPSLHSSANNHLVAESAALFILGSIAPGIPEAGRWREIGWKRLVTEADRQVLPDGAGAEQSPTYLAYTLEWMLISRQVFIAQSGDGNSALDSALRRGAQSISSMADRAGNVPFIGDCDDGVVLRPRLRETKYLPSLVSAVAGCLGDATLMHPAFSPDLRAHMLTNSVVPVGRCKLDSTTFQDGGYTIIRETYSGTEIFLLFDHGPLGFAQTAAHGHADALAVWLHVDGKPVLADFGTYRYFADNGFRAWARSTAAHNTVEIAGVSQSEVTGPFNWGKRTEAHLLERSGSESENKCRAMHSGYAAEYGVLHERTLTIAAPGKITILDEVKGSGGVEFRLSFHFASDIEVEAADQDGHFRSARNGLAFATMTINCEGLQTQVIRQSGELQPGPGVVSKRYNHLVPACSVVFTGKLSLPRVIRSTIDLL